MAKKGSLNEKILPDPLESTNVVNHLVPFYKPCEGFHDEILCVITRRILGEGASE